jgi:ATP synthase protein I
MAETPGGDGRSLKERLDAARSRQGLDSAAKPSQPGNPVDGSVLGLGLRVGGEVIAAMLVGLAIGWGLDRVFGTRPIFLGLFLLIGGAAGIRNVWRLVAPPQ